MLPRLHIVTDEEILARPEFEPEANRLVRELGQRIAIHVRSRQAGGRRLFEIAAGLMAQPDAFVVVNDHVDVARAARTVAVQLPAASLPVEVVRQQLPGVEIGKSVHTAAQGASAARAGADFLLAGSIYASDSHPGIAPQGIALIDALGSTGVPVLAIGGIDGTRVSECMAAGAYGVAVIRAVWHAPDPVGAAKELVRRIEESMVNA